MLPFCSACNTDPQGPGFIIRTHTQDPSFHFKLADLKEGLLSDDDTTVMQVESRPSFSSAKLASKPFIDV